MIDTKRHKQIFNPDTFNEPVHIIGCGGMGSRIAEGLVRMGVGEKQHIYLYDPDTFEAHNVANQWVDDGAIMETKVHAVAKAMKRINPDCKITPRAVRVSSSSILKGVVFLCLDSMAARRQIMENAIEQSRWVDCVIETRMDAETGISHCFDPHNRHQNDCWWLYWYADKETEHIGGCNQPQSIISAIYGTTMLALKQFEQYARIGKTVCMANRVYIDFDTMKAKTEEWVPLD